LKLLLQQGKKLNNTALIALMLLFGGALFGCSDSTKAPVTPSPTVAPKPIAQPASQATLTTEEKKELPAFSYNPQGRPDPFAPLITKEETKARAGSRPPLERYSISEFKLTGIVWGGFGYNAMIEGPDGKGYFVRVGTTIGPNKGIVKRITKDTMEIEEKFKNVLGAIESKQITIKLRQKQEGMP
jgi:type IV pilus assembly protein PilP